MKPGERIMRNPVAGLLALAIIVIIPGAVPASYAAVAAKRKPLPRAGELAAAANVTVQRGLKADLPPHIATLLGLSREEKCPVLQGVLRSGGRVQGIEVSEKNHDDLVLFVVNEASGDQTYYLTSPAGALRKMLSVKQGVGQLVDPSKDELDAFEKEKKSWTDQLSTETAAK